MTIYPWQHRQWSSVTQWQSEAHWPNALLLVGPEDVGKRDFASAMARVLLCETPDAAGTPCGKCHACNLQTAGTHPDSVMVTQPERNKRIGIEDIRNLIDKLSLTAVIGIRKVAQIHPAQRMTTHASNSLLKTLEEPPGDTVIILIADELHQLPRTILSRCQRLNFPLPEPAVTLSWLKAISGDERKTAACLQLAGGRPLLARELAQSEARDVRPEILATLRRLLCDDYSPAAVAKEWLSLGLPDVTEWLVSLLGDVIRLKTLGTAEYLTNPDLAESMQDLAEQLDLDAMFELLDEVRAVQIRHSLHTGLNEQLALEALAIRWSQGSSGHI